eukprot:CFRG1118T1
MMDVAVEHNTGFEEDNDQDEILNTSERSTHFEKTIRRSESELFTGRRSRTGNIRATSTAEIAYRKDKLLLRREDENAKLRLVIAQLEKKLAESEAQPNKSYTQDANVNGEFNDKVLILPQIIVTQNLSLDEELAKFKEQVENLQTQLDDVISENHTLKTHLETAREANPVELVAAQNGQSKEIDTMRNQIVELESERDSLTAELEQIDEEIEQQMETYSEALRIQAKEQLNAAVSMQRELETEVAEVRKMLNLYESGNSMNEGQVQYLRNILLKYMSGVQQKQLIPVIGTILNFSPDEIKACMALLPVK